MSRITTLGSWEAENVRVSQVEEALSALRRHEERAAVRTSVLTLVVVVDDRPAADAVLQTVHDLGERHPSRTLVLVVGPAAARHEGQGALDASASVHVVERGGRAVCFEDLVIEVRGRARHHLESVVEPFTLPEVPMVVWLPSRLPSPGDPLLEVANRVVVDSRAVGDEVDVLGRIAVLSRRLPMADLSWIRLVPWRRLMAGLFEGRTYRPFLKGITGVEVAGHFGPRHVLGGWLVKRLGLPLDVLSLKSAPHVSIGITCVHEGRTGVFRVDRPGNDRVILASVAIEDGPSFSQCVQVESRWPALALAEALTTMGSDADYRDALSGAVELRRLATESRGS